MRVNVGELRVRVDVCESKCGRSARKSPSPIAIDILIDAMARDRVYMYLFSV